jgi:hypothetical protein
MDALRASLSKLPDMAAAPHYQDTMIAFYGLQHNKASRWAGITRL